MPEKALTNRQSEIFNFVKEFWEKRGAPPTQSEIAAHFGLKGEYGVRQHLRLIQNKGYLQLIPGKARGIKIPMASSPEPGREIHEIPLVGRITAGQPNLAVENIQEYIKMGVGLFHGRNLFALRVHGDSMINAGIEDGDIAIIDQQPDVENGEVAAVILDDEATLKRVLREKGRVRLKAENDRYPDIVITSKSGKEVRIAGRFVGLIRQRGAKKTIRSGGLP